MMSNKIDMDLSLDEIIRRNNAEKLAKKSKLTAPQNDDRNEVNKDDLATGQSAEKSNRSSYSKFDRFNKKDSDSDDEGISSQNSSANNSLSWPTRTQYNNNSRKNEPRTSGYNRGNSRGNSNYNKNSYRNPRANSHGSISETSSLGTFTYEQRNGDIAGINRNQRQPNSNQPGFEPASLTSTDLVLRQFVRMPGTNQKVELQLNLTQLIQNGDRRVQMKELPPPSQARKRFQARTSVQSRLTAQATSISLPEFNEYPAPKRAKFVTPVASNQMKVKSAEEKKAPVLAPPKLDFFPNGIKTTYSQIPGVGPKIDLMKEAEDLRKTLEEKKAREAQRELEMERIKYLEDIDENALYDDDDDVELGMDLIDEDALLNSD